MSDPVRKRGNIYNSPYAGRAKEYAWNLCLKYAPRGITPSDVDYTVECNSRFLFFEMKTEGAEMPKGQRIYYERLLAKLDGDAVLFIVEHPALDVVEMPTDVTGFTVMFYRDGKIIEKRLSPSEFAQKYAGFFEWAESNTGVPRFKK